MMTKFYFVNAINAPVSDAFVELTPVQDPAISGSDIILGDTVSTVSDLNGTASFANLSSFTNVSSNWYEVNATTIREKTSFYVNIPTGSTGLVNAGQYTVSCSINNGNPTDVYFSLKDCNGASWAVKRVVLTPIAIPNINNDNIGLGNSITYTSSLNGTVTFPTVLPGVYKVTAHGFRKQSILFINVPAGSGSVNAVDIMTVPTHQMISLANLQGSFVGAGLTKEEADKLYQTIIQSGSFYNIDVTSADSASYILASGISGTVNSASYSFTASYAKSASYSAISDKANQSTYATSSLSATTSATASYLNGTASAASYALRADQATFATSAFTAGTATTSATASYVKGVNVSGIVLSASSSVSASYSTTSSRALNANEATYATSSLSASYARSASVSLTSNSASYSFTASYAKYAANIPTSVPSSSYASSSLSASYANSSTSASYARSASVSISASYARSASYVTNMPTTVLSASWASRSLSTTSASYADIAQTALTFISSVLSASFASSSLSASIANTAKTASMALSLSAMPPVSAYNMQFVGKEYAKGNVFASDINKLYFTDTGNIYCIHLYGSASYADNANQAKTASYLAGTASVQFAAMANYANVAGYALDCLTSSVVTYGDGYPIMMSDTGIVGFKFLDENTSQSLFITHRDVHVPSKLVLDYVFGNHPLINSNSIVTASAISNTELSYLLGATSNIQAQINSIAVGSGVLTSSYASKSLQSIFSTQSLYATQSLYSTSSISASYAKSASIANNALILNNLLVASSSADDRWIQFNDNEDSRISYNDAAVRFYVSNPIQAPNFLGTASCIPPNTPIKFGDSTLFAEDGLTIDGTIVFDVNSTVTSYSPITASAGISASKVNALEITSSNGKFNRLSVTNDLYAGDTTINSLNIAGQTIIDDFGNINAYGDITASHFIGTASIATNAINATSASFASRSISASYADLAANANTASLSLLSRTASLSFNSNTASLATTAVNSSNIAIVTSATNLPYNLHFSSGSSNSYNQTYIDVSSSITFNPSSKELVLTGSMVATSVTASLKGSASYSSRSANAETASFAFTSVQSAFSTQSVYATQSLNATRSIFSTQSLYSTQSIYSTQSLFATRSIYATQSLFATSSLTASLLTETATGTGLIVRQANPTLVNLTSSVINTTNIKAIPTTDTLTINARRISHVAGANSTILGYNGLLNTSQSQYDVAIGYQAGQNAVTTSFGVLIGASAGYNATNIETAILIGVQAGMSLTNSYSSIFIGGNAGVRAGNCAGTVAVGVTSLPDCPSAFYGVAIGGYAGEKVKNADRSVLIGGPAAQNADTVTNSVIIGSYAGNNAKTGSNAIMIGYQSDVLNSLVDANGSIGIGYQTKITKPYQTIIGNVNTSECLLYGAVSASQLTSSNSKFDNVRVDNDLSVINAATVNSLDVAGSLTIDDLGVVNSIGNITAPNFIGTASLAKTASLWTEQNTKLNVADPNSSGSFIHTGSFVVKNATYVNPVSNVILTFTSGAGDYVAGYGNYGVRVYAYKTVGGINVYSTPVEVLQSDTSGTGLSIDDFYGVHIAWTQPSDADGCKILFYSDNKSYNWNVSHTGGGNYYDDSGGGLSFDVTVTPTSPLIGVKSVINSPLDITGSVIITGSLIADLIGNASSATTASYSVVAETLAPKTSSWWIPLTSTVDSNGSFTALSNALQGSWLGTNYFNYSQQYSSGSGAITTRMAQLENDKIIGRNFRLTNYYAYSHSLASWSFTPYLGIAGIHMTGSTTSASWASVTNAVARPLSGKGITSWSYSATAPSTDMFFHIRSGCGSPVTHTNTVWLIGIKVENW